MQGPYKSSLILLVFFIACLQPSGHESHGYSSSPFLGGILLCCCHLRHVVRICCLRRWGGGNSPRLPVEAQVRVILDRRVSGIGASKGGNSCSW